MEEDIRNEFLLALQRHHEVLYYFQEHSTTEAEEFKKNHLAYQSSKKDSDKELCQNTIKALDKLTEGLIRLFHEQQQRRVLKVN